MKAVEADAGALQRHMSGTYFSLRLGMGIIAALLPLLLWLGGALGDHESLRCSMSAYYHSPTMRDVFVGALVAIGAFLYLYKGFSTRENWALNLAGAFAVGIAMVPTGAECGTGTGGFSLHATFAVLFFACIAYVAVFRASDTLSLIRDVAKAERLRATYRLLGIGMVVSPLIALVLNVAFERVTAGGTLVFFVEAVAVLMFASYWLVKSREMQATDAERLALERKLQAKSSTPPPGANPPGRIVQIEA